MRQCLELVSVDIELCYVGVNTVIPEPHVGLNN